MGYIKIKDRELSRILHVFVSLIECRKKKNKISCLQCAKELEKIREDLLMLIGE